MKRLLKKADSDVHEVFDFLGMWLMDWDRISSSTISKMIDENQDCLYAGIGFRSLEFFTRTIGRKISKWENGAANKEAIDEAVRSMIESGDAYQSFAKTESGVLEFASDYESSGFETQWVIQSNISGLDLHALYEKYKDQMKGGSIGAYERYEEVLSSLKDFTIIGPIVNGTILKDYTMTQDSFKLQ